MSKNTNLAQREKVKEIIEKYRRSGEISKKAKKLARKLCIPGAKAYDIGEKVEALIKKEGAKTAFPINISINHEAAHYSPEILDNRIIPENCVVKIDLGAEIDGYIVDTAITVNHDPAMDELSNVSLEALDAAIELIKPGIRVKEIGKVIEKIIKNAGFEPVKNLSGHQIKRYNLHAGVSIPNTSTSFFDRANPKIEAGRIYAIEPFASTGKGWVDNDRVTNIFRYVRNPTRKSDQEIKIMAKEVKDKVGVLPFSPRHLYNQGGKSEKREISKSIHKLLRANVIMGYPVLIETDREVRVSQHEDTVRITKNGCENLTR